MTKKIDSLYVHFPFCLHLCNYCDFYKRKTSAVKSDLPHFHQFLIDSFERHERLTKELGYSFVPLKTLYVGGGTPSLWGTEGALFLKQFLKEHNLELSADCEFTLEVNPKAWTPESISAFESIGVNRFSIGVQTLNAEIIPFLDRYHNIDDVFETLEFFKNKQANFSIDFMLGLPMSIKNSRDIEKELQTALSFNPQHFSVYILTVKDNYKHFLSLPDEDWIHDEFMKTSDFLIKAGFDHYEVSNFSRPERQSRHNLNYWKSSTVAALGASATGFLSADRLRYKWKTQSAEFETEMLTEKEFFLEKIYMGLRSSTGISPVDFQESKDKFEEIVQKWDRQGLLKESSPQVILNSKGYLILDTLMNDLFILLD